MQRFIGPDYKNKTILTSLVNVRFVAEGRNIVKFLRRLSLQLREARK